MDLNTGSGDNTVIMQATGGEFGGPGQSHGLSVNGEGGTNTLVGPNAGSDWSITGQDSGTFGTSGGDAFLSFQNLTGGTGLDVFTLSPGAGVTGSIDGGGGGDWLDYLPYSTPISADLALGTATGVGGTVQNIQNIRGGSGGATLRGDSQGNILIGGTGDDSIKGGSGRSILIGGKGNNTVTGGASDDIIIGGFSDLDQNSLVHDAAIQSILAEWQSSDSFTQRVDFIRNGGGSNGTNVLVPGSTVHDSGATDILTGDGGINWFFKGTNDTITDLDLSAGDQVN